MQVINSHNRIISQPIEKVSQLFKTLATSEDRIWPYENWPAIRFKDGIKVGSKGGHGRIRYTIIKYVEGKYIKFKFSKPEGFNGTHHLKIEHNAECSTIISHEINAHLSFKASCFWVIVIRWLHDALIEDAFDKVENYFSTDKRDTKHNFWVKFLRGVYKRPSFKIKHG